MDLVQALPDLASCVSALAAAVAVGVGVRTYRRQTNAQMFVEYTRRFHEVMALFPADSRGARLDLDTALPPESDELTLAVLRYLNLSSEEYYLYRRGYLAKDVWTIWEAEIDRTLQSPLFRREWPRLRNEFISFSEFSRYVEALLAPGRGDGQKVEARRLAEPAPPLVRAAQYD